MGRSPAFKSTKNRDDYIRRIIERRPLAGRPTSGEFDDHPSPSAVADGYEAEVEVKANFPSRKIAQKPDIVFTASATYLPRSGDKVELIWETNNAKEVVISPDVGAVPTKGKLWVTVFDDTVYTLTASNKIGEATASVRVEIDKLDKPIDKPDDNIDDHTDDKEEMWSWIEAEPEEVSPGGMTTLRWGVDDRADQVKLILRTDNEETAFDVENKGIKDMYVEVDTTFTIAGVGGNVKQITHSSVHVDVRSEIDIPDDPKDDFVSERPRFVVDRRPVAAVNAYGGLYDQTPTGQSRWFYEPGGVQEFLERKVYPMMDIGYERFMMWLPAGSNRQRYMASAQWGPLPEYRKLEFRDVLGNFLEEYPHIDFGIYMGYKIHDPFSLRMPERDLREPDLSVESDRYWFRQTIQPWVDVGANWFMGDAASAEESRAGAVEIADALSIANLKYGGEALPTIKLGGGEWDIDEEYINEMPWSCLHFFAHARDSGYEWKFDTRKSEIGLVFSGHSDQRELSQDFNEIEKRVMQGYVPWCMLGPQDDRTPFIYSLGSELAGQTGFGLEENQDPADTVDVTSTPESD